MNLNKIVTTITFEIILSSKDFLVRLRYFLEINLLADFDFILKGMSSVFCVSSPPAFRAQFATLLPAFVFLRLETTGTCQFYNRWPRPRSGFTETTSIFRHASVALPLAVNLTVFLGLL